MSCNNAHNTYASSRPAFSARAAVCNEWVSRSTAKPPKSPPSNRRCASTRSGRPAMKSAACEPMIAQSPAVLSCMFAKVARSVVVPCAPEDVVPCAPEDVVLCAPEDRVVMRSLSTTGNDPLKVLERLFEHVHGHDRESVANAAGAHAGPVAVERHLGRRRTGCPQLIAVDMAERRLVDPADVPFQRRIRNYRGDGVADCVLSHRQVT